MYLLEVREIAGSQLGVDENPVDLDFEGRSPTDGADDVGARDLEHRDQSHFRAHIFWRSPRKVLNLMRHLEG